MNNDHTFFPGYHPDDGARFRKPISAANVREAFSLCSDFNERELLYGLTGTEKLTVFWLDGVASAQSISELVIRPLTDRLRALPSTGADELENVLSLGGIYSAAIKHRGALSDVIDDLTHGFCAVVSDSLGSALTFELKSDKVRSVDSPTLEKSLKGAKDSFVEVIRVNTALVRRRVCSPSLKCVESSLGRKSSTKISVMFIEGVANPDTVKSLARRLDAIDVDAVTSVGTIEHYIIDAPLSPFPQLIHTERPDRFAGYLLDGRIGILIDGLPIGLVLPVTFAAFMTVTGDSNQHFLVSTGLGLLRYLALLLGLLLPAFYVAIAMYHQEMIPSGLLLSMINAKQNVPFSTGAEIIGMLITFSLLQEAGLRLPNPVGDTVSIIGALIVGQSAVDAQVASPIAIIVVATSGIACYTLPSQDLGSAVRIFRLAAVIAAAVCGFYGVAIVTAALIYHLSELDSFGVSYTSPLTDERPGGLFRLLIKPPARANKFRDSALKTPDRRRQK